MTRYALEIHYLGTHKPMVLTFDSKALAEAHAAAEVPKYNDVSAVIFRPVEEKHPGLVALPGSPAVLH